METYYYNPAPIVLFVYNRPCHTRQTVEALQKNVLASESDLYIFADGPKRNATEECLYNIYKVRQYIHTIVGFKNIFIDESINNIGLDNSIIKGVSKILQNNNKAIILEDDIVTHYTFLQYMNDCLIKYYDNDNIYMISGFSCNIKLPKWYQKYIYLLHRPSSWGWGIWSNRWNKIIWDKQQLSIENFSQKQKNKFNRGGNDLYRMFSSFYENKIMPWDIRFAYNMYLYNTLCIYPRFSFINNIGFDGSGEHCGEINTKGFTAASPNSYIPKDLPNSINYSPIVEYRFRQFLKRYDKINK